MQAVEIVQHLQTAYALLSVEGEEVHVVVVHAHEATDGSCFLGVQIIPVQRRTAAELGIEQVEIITGQVSVEVGIKSQKARKTHEEDQVEIGHTASRASVKPADGVGQVGKERTVGALFAQGMIEKLTQEQSDGRLDRVEGQRRERMKQTGFGDAAQLGRVFPFSLQLHQGKRVE